MESKHFSHHHPLFLHQLPPPSHHHCSGCKSPATGNVYACWQCSYFLHEQCFRATRSLKHPSHPLHPLTLVPFPTYPSSSFFCNSCNLAGDAFSYTCPACEFDIHLHCALMPNPNPNPHLSPSPIPAQNHHINPIYPSQNAAAAAAATNTHTPPRGYPQQNATPQNPTPTTNPQPKPVGITKHFSHPHALKQTKIEPENTNLCSACELRLSGGSAYRCTEPQCYFSLHETCFDLPQELLHKSHPHPLTLRHATPYSWGSFLCDACRKTGKAFTYTCSKCSYDLHIGCIRWPETMTRPDHSHSLSLFYKPPVAAGEVFVCDVCREAADEKGWMYYCRECDFGTHLVCVKAEIKKQEVAGGGEAAVDVQAELYSLQQQKVILEMQIEMSRKHNEFMLSMI